VTVEIRPTVAADLDRFAWRNRYRLRAWTALHEGRIIGIGGVQIMDDGTQIGFADLMPELRCHPLALHRAARRFMGEIRRAGSRRVVAMADPEQPAARRWLERLGFKPVEIDGTKVYLWQV
jgi:RimJ/RimL family protein N-acetyltransferase